MPPRRALNGRPLTFNTAHQPTLSHSAADKEMFPKDSCKSKQENQSEDQHSKRWNDVFSMIRDVIYPLTESQDEYLSTTAYKKLGITWTSLDFDTGKPGNGGEQYILPTPREQINSLLQTTKPWEIRRDFVQEAVSSNTPQWEATWFYRLIMIYLTNDETEEERGIMSIHSHWVEFAGASNNAEHLNRLSHGKVDWQLKGILRRCQQTADENPFPAEKDCDSSTPHVTGVLANGAALKEDALSIAEITTILFLSCAYVSIEAHREHRVIPVTIISGSNRSVRIVQGQVDMATRKIEIRKSQIISFEQGVMNNYDEYLTLLGWMMGKPVGNTR